MKTLIAATLAAAALAVPVNAEAASHHRPAPKGGVACVTYNEWLYAPRDTMSGLEAYLGVTGAGFVVQTREQGKYVIKQYAYCGDAYDYVQVSYTRNTAGQYMSQFISLWQVS